MPTVLMRTAGALFIAVAVHTLAPCPGDITGNGTVGLDDFAILAGDFGAGPGATREQGDLNGDGFVDLADFNILAVNFGADCN